MPVVFASRYGDAERSLRLLGEFASEGAMSPADFTLSVHNAVGALYSIARQDTAPYASIAAGAASAAAGAIEAAALLADGAAEVLLVCCDAPLPGDYQAFNAEPGCPYAWAWRMSPVRAGQPAISLAWTAAAGHAEDAGPLPFGLAAMQFAASGMPSIVRYCEGMQWTWSRDA